MLIEQRPQAPLFFAKKSRTGSDLCGIDPSIITLSHQHQLLSSGDSKFSFESVDLVLEAFRLFAVLPTEHGQLAFRCLRTVSIARWIPSEERSKISELDPLAYTHSSALRGPSRTPHFS